jgi:hypothetical protein
VRAIDWRVTARTGEPHTRVYNEEKDRPALVVVDQRLAMFYGTRLSLKSVTAAEAAALAAWRVFRSGDRVGAVVFDDRGLEALRPHRSRGQVLRILQAIVRKNRALRAEATVAPAPGMLNQALERALRLVDHDHAVLVASDFDGADADTRRLASALSQHNDVIVMLVLDPSSKDLPERGRAVVSGGELQLQLDLGRAGEREALLSVASARIKPVLRWTRELGIPVLPLSTARTRPRRSPACWRRLRGGSDDRAARDTRPLRPSAAPAPVEGLRDIAMPAPWRVLPPAPGGTGRPGPARRAFWGYRRHRRARAASRYRREALAELESIVEALQHPGGRHELAARLPPLLKRVALHVEPRRPVAALTGPRGSPSSTASTAATNGPRVRAGSSRSSRTGRRPRSRASTRRHRRARAPEPRLHRRHHAAASRRSPAPAPAPRERRPHEQPSRSAPSALSWPVGSSTLELAAPWALLLRAVPVLAFRLLPPYKQRQPALRVPFFGRSPRASGASPSQERSCCRRHSCSGSWLRRFRPVGRCRPPGPSSCCRRFRRPSRCATCCWRSTSRSRCRRRTSSTRTASGGSGSTR